MQGDRNELDVLRRLKRRRGFRQPGFEWVERRRLTRVGGSIMVALPKRLIASQLHAEAGDDVFLIEVDGGLLITAVDPRFEWKLERHESLLRASAASIQRAAHARL